VPTARAPAISLPAGGSELKLVAVNPGSREYLRASVDYERPEQPRARRLQSGVQRVRTAGSELVEDQEIYRRVSVVPLRAASSRRAARIALVRVASAVPAQRPDRSAGGPGGVAVATPLNPDGMTAAAQRLRLSAPPARATGLFALQASPLQPAVHPAAYARARCGTGRLCWSPAACAETQALLLVIRRS